jgi:hypothetical protein
MDKITAAVDQCALTVGINGLMLEGPNPFVGNMLIFRALVCPGLTAQPID